MVSSQAFDKQLPTDIDMQSADQLRQIIASAMERGGGGAKIKFADAEGELAEVILTPKIAETFLSILRHISSGKGFHVLPYKAELTTQQAADFLNVSRPYLIKLLDKGEIDYGLVGRHRRIKAEDLFAYMEMRDERRAEALERLAEADADLGLI